MSKKRTFLRNSRKASVKQQAEQTALLNDFCVAAAEAYEAGSTTMQIPYRFILAVKAAEVLDRYNISPSDYSKESQQLVAKDMQAVVTDFLDEHDCSSVDFTL